MPFNEPDSGTPDPQTRLLLVEDDPQIARVLIRALARGAIETTWLTDGLDADAALADPARPFDAAVIDIGLPGCDGIEVLRRLRRRGAPLPVLLLTARDETADRVIGLDAGADDYLPKPFDLSELEARVRALLRRRRHVGEPDTDLRFGRLSRVRGEARLRLDGRPMDLTPREAGVLGVLLQRAGRVASKTLVLQELALTDFSALELNDAAVEVIIHRLRRKLERSGTEIHTVRGFGYLLRLADDPGSTAHGGPEGQP